MKKYVRIIDNKGMFIEDAFVEELTEFTIETPCPSGFYQPKWDGNEWVEGLRAEEIQALTKYSNEQIRELRQQAYKDRSDILYLAWQKYLATGEDKAEQARQMWLAEVAKIDKEFPYNE